MTISRYNGKVWLSSKCLYWKRRVERPWIQWRSYHIIAVREGNTRINTHSVSFFAFFIALVNFGRYSPVLVFRSNRASKFFIFLSLVLYILTKTLASHYSCITGVVSNFRQLFPDVLVIREWSFRKQGAGTFWNIHTSPTPLQFPCQKQKHQERLSLSEVFSVTIFILYKVFIWS